MSQKATFAAGCFWGVEETFAHLKGVLSTQVGYTGGGVKNPSYEAVCTGKTGHAESVQIEFDPRQISYAALLNIFWNSHDPTTVNRQGPDIGSQYRSAIFFHSRDQENEALISKEKLMLSGHYNVPIATEILSAQEFYPAEEYHQKYFEKNGLSHCKTNEK